MCSLQLSTPDDLGAQKWKQRKPHLQLLPLVCGQNISPMIVFFSTSDFWGLKKSCWHLPFLTQKAECIREAVASSFFSMKRTFWPFKKGKPGKSSSSPVMILALLSDGNWCVINPCFETCYGIQSIVPKHYRSQQPSCVGVRSHCRSHLPPPFPRNILKWCYSHRDWLRVFFPFLNVEFQHLLLTTGVISHLSALQFK